MEIQCEAVRIAFVRIDDASAIEPRDLSVTLPTCFATGGDFWPVGKYLLGELRRPGNDVVLFEKAAFIQQRLPCRASG